MEYTLATPTDWNKECDLAIERLRENINFLPSVTIYNLKDIGILYTRPYDMFPNFLIRKFPAF